jgi:hypothetical protein
MSAEISLTASTGKDSTAGLPAEKAITSEFAVAFKISLIAEGLSEDIRFENK